MTPRSSEGGGYWLVWFGIPPPLEAAAGKTGYLLSSITCLLEFGGVSCYALVCPPAFWNGLPTCALVLTGYTGYAKSPKSSNSEAVFIEVVWSAALACAEIWSMMFGGSKLGAAFVIWRLSSSPPIMPWPMFVFCK